MPLYSPNNRYRLVLANDGLGSARTLQFDAPSPEAALQRAQQHCAGREAELFENERSLGRLRCALDGGYWMLSETPARDRSLHSA